MQLEDKTSQEIISQFNTTTQRLESWEIISLRWYILLDFVSEFFQFPVKETIFACVCQVFHRHSWT